MKQAVYNADNVGHFGLALKRYTSLPRRSVVTLTCYCAGAIKYLIAKRGVANVGHQRRAVTTTLSMKWTSTASSVQ
ncbi:hypothetical protein OH492_22130 [Vibrio chagasii]|nr:hypothetical protein [Vibrio chagasii]